MERLTKWCESLQEWQENHDNDERKGFRNGHRACIRGWLGGCEALSKYVSNKHKLQLDSKTEYNMELYYLPISEKEL